MNMDDYDANGFGIYMCSVASATFTFNNIARPTLLDVVATDESLQIQSQTLWSNVLRSSCIDSTRDEPRNEGEIHHIRQRSVHRHDGNGNSRKTHERDECRLHTLQGSA